MLIIFVIDAEMRDFFKFSCIPDKIFFLLVNSIGNTLHCALGFFFFEYSQFSVHSTNIYKKYFQWNKNIFIK